MNPDLFKNLPPEIITEIFLRLPVVSIPISKCVCKRWLHLLEFDAFAKSHFARSAPALVVLGFSGGLNVLEFEGELDLHLHLHPLTNYDFPYGPANIYSYNNGLLVLRLPLDVLCVCNPITREVIKLDLRISDLSAHGFGASKISGRYKAVCFHSKHCDDKPDCYVYTLGTGSRRRLEECFSFFKAPPYHARRFPFTKGTSISALNGCLWFCKVASEYGYENDGGRCELTIWIMKEYGVDESWSMEYVIRLDGSMRWVDPIKVFENGDLFMRAYSPRRHFYYSNKTKTMQRVDLFGAERASDWVECGLFTRTFVSLKTLGLGVENVISF
ncbi:F-box protein CPR1-like [Salvia miltiorrhiza]|uniref:F-box protein CPR1-like n=1 Tax=Salvia miltiorrhiza TaxID=226208 RepID=UPI0025ABA57A|nr:F-box protein CPR1-like [Salvia miltiorrhiza]